MKILYFIGTLRSGGKERRLIELMAGLKEKTDFEILLVLAFNHIDYDYFKKLNINYMSINKKKNHKSLKVFFQLNKIIKEFKPDILHSWGSMQSFYMGPLSFIHRIPLINSQITDAPPNIPTLSFRNIINKINFFFSDVILSNSNAGLKAYNADNNKKSRVIYNGFDFDRISNLADKESIKNKFNIKSKYIVGMVASFSNKKDYTTYIKASQSVLNERNDVTFLCIGAGNDLPYKNMIDQKYKDKILLLGRQEKVESIMNICEVGVLASNPNTHGEGISNVIMEFMALGKPVVATQGGGTSEIIINNETGYIIDPKEPFTLKQKILELLSSFYMRTSMGEKGKKKIIEEFSINKMINKFTELYNEV
jgi:glycosyltransferase involved in cell wall biosynthesis